MTQSEFATEIGFSRAALNVALNKGRCTVKMIRAIRNFIAGKENINLSNFILKRSYDKLEENDVS